jgi:hypothetical protein
MSAGPIRPAHVAPLFPCILPPSISEVYRGIGPVSIGRVLTRRAVGLI